LWFVLSRQLSKSFLGFLYISQSEFTGFNQAGHDGLRAPAEKRQQIVDQPALGSIARDRSFKNVKVADLPDAAHGLLGFQSIDRGLDRGVSRPAFFREGFSLTSQREGKSVRDSLRLRSGWLSLRQKNV
jgi:hypothetical protein